MSDTDESLEQAVQAEIALLLERSSGDDEGVFLQALAASADRDLRRRYILWRGARRLKQAQEQLDGDKGLSLGLVSSANIAKLADIERLELLVKRLRRAD